MDPDPIPTYVETCRIPEQRFMFYAYLPQPFEVILVILVQNSTLQKLGRLWPRPDCPVDRLDRHPLEVRVTLNENCVNFDFPNKITYRPTYLTSSS